MTHVPYFCVLRYQGRWGGCTQSRSNLWRRAPPALHSTPGEALCYILTLLFLLSSALGVFAALEQGRGTFLMHQWRYAMPFDASSSGQSGVDKNSDNETLRLHHQFRA